MVITPEELFVNGKLAISRKDAYGKRVQAKNVPVFTSRLEKREYYNALNYFNIRNVLDIRGFLTDIRDHWHAYVSLVHQWIQKSPMKKLIVTGIFTVVFGFLAGTANAAFITEYTYQVKNGDKIEEIAAAHGVTPQEILDANGVSSIEGKKILLPKVQDKTVTATILNIRTHPNTESSIIGTYKKGNVAKVAFVENGWAGILIDGRVCFVKAEYLTENVTPNPTVSTGNSQTMSVTATTLRVREAASTNSAVIGLLILNDRVSVISTSKGWAKIEFNGKMAFVSESYLTSTELVKDTSKNSTAVYVIKPGDTFTSISNALGVSIAAIQKLNPTADSTRLKIGQQINIPSNAAATKSGTVNNTPKADTSTAVYVIKPGDTFTKISQVLGVPIAAIQKLNPTADSTRLKIGQQINIPSNAAATKSGTVNNTPKADTSTAVYVIKPGDTFTKISQVLGVPIAAIQKLNPTADSTRLKIGQQINIPGKTVSVPNQLTVEAQITGVDPQGTFRFITPTGKTYAAEAYGISVNDLFDLIGKKVTLTLEEKRGQLLKLISLE